MRVLVGRMLCAAAAMAVSSAGNAGVGVQFVDGRALQVAGAELTDGAVILILEDGGRIGVPADRIRNLDDLTHLAATDSFPSSAKRSQASLRSIAEYKLIIERAARRHEIDGRLLVAIAEVGSGFDPFASSPDGGRGLMNIKPEVVNRYRLTDVYDPSQNVDAAARYLSSLLVRFEGRTDLALAAYNAGVDAVERHRGVPAYRKTTKFVSEVTARMRDSVAPPR